jgi:hypothetical protein
VVGTETLAVERPIYFLSFPLVLGARITPSPKQNNIKYLHVRIQHLSKCQVVFEYFLLILRCSFAIEIITYLLDKPSFVSFLCHLLYLFWRDLGGLFYLCEGGKNDPIQIFLARRRLFWTSCKSDGVHNNVR